MAQMAHKWRINWGNNWANWAIISQFREMKILKAF
jgi:hypothetical protein